ncbi:hypothetical protein [Fusobacterium sp. CM22]|jgi:lipoprotein|uniref:hypothetical protein n=1 Tax=Fusobacterium sp. CM22 TaxID=936563 RepID=UPI00044AE7E6|nr:hypothetical protein [Fusobacterium sp. CM22]EUB15690.1 hypothetical protein HMPREF1500_0916 [Fusobacterium sp. CM22]
MKKWLLVLMVVLGISCFADWTVVASGTDKYTKGETYHPGVAVLHDYKTDKYTICRFTYANGFDMNVNSEITKEDFTYEILDLSSGGERGSGIKCIIVMKFNGKKCSNLTYEQTAAILKKINYEEYKYF